MAIEIEAPFTDAEVDPSDPTGSALSIVFSILGMGLFFMVVAYGRRTSSVLQRFVGNLTGFETDEETTIEVV